MLHSTCRVCILMSTYNGEAYLHQQIDSLLAQELPDIRLLVRDDGSRDSTRDILQEYQSAGKLQWYTGENLGPAQSFLDLLQNSSDADFYAFCDQDDVWLPEKLRCAVAQLEASEKEIKCYFSAYTPVDAQLNALEIPLIPVLPFTLEATLISNSAVGCTMVLSKALRDRINAYRPRSIFMHDWWAYLVCLALEGAVVYDTTAHILYRQHGSNVVGANDGFLKKVKRRLAVYRNQDLRRSNHARELLRGYREELSVSVLSQLAALAEYDRSFGQRLKFAAFCHYSCGRKLKDLLFRMDALLGKL